MTYKYCTKKMVTKAVRQGREAVIKCSSDKWWWYGTCTEKELKRSLRNYLGTNCALCEYRISFSETDEPYCGDCGFSSHCYWHRDKDLLFWQAEDLLEEWEAKPTATNFKKLQAKARKMARIIGRLK